MRGLCWQVHREQVHLASQSWLQHHLPVVASSSVQSELAARGVVVTPQAFLRDVRACSHTAVAACASAEHVQGPAAAGGELIVNLGEMEAEAATVEAVQAAAQALVDTRYSKCRVREHVR